MKRHSLVFFFFWWTQNTYSFLFSWHFQNGLLSSCKSFSIIPSMFCSSHNNMYERLVFISHRVLFFFQFFFFNFCNIMQFNYTKSKDVRQGVFIFRQPVLFFICLFVYILLPIKGSGAGCGQYEITFSLALVTVKVEAIYPAVG